MRAATALSLCVATLLLVRGAVLQNGQAVFKPAAISTAEPDFVDTLVDEARDRKVALDDKLRVVEESARAMAGWSYSICGNEHVAVDIEKIAVEPDPPRGGQNLTIHGVGSTDALIAVSLLRGSR